MDITTRSIPAAPHRREILAAGVAAIGGSALAQPQAARTTVWNFSRLDGIGGRTTRMLGAPQLVAGPFGRAAWFDGAGDALFVDQHPLAGASAFTIEAVFRPDGGKHEQRWLHLAEDPSLPASQAVSGGTRMLFEVRVVEAGWYLDAFIKGPDYSQTLMNAEKTHPLGRWSHVAQVCDGKRYACFVDGELQADAAVDFRPQGPGRTSVGVRMNRVDWFRGAVAEARFTPRALRPSEFRMLRR
jgi:hypothetical protein